MFLRIRLLKKRVKNCSIKNNNGIKKFSIKISTPPIYVGGRDIGIRRRRRNQLFRFQSLSHKLIKIYPNKRQFFAAKRLPLIWYHHRRRRCLRGWICFNDNSLCAGCLINEWSIFLHTSIHHLLLCMHFYFSRRKIDYSLLAWRRWWLLPSFISLPTNLAVKKMCLEAMTFHSSNISLCTYDRLFLFFFFLLIISHMILIFLEGIFCFPPSEDLVIHVVVIIVTSCKSKVDRKISIWPIFFDLFWSFF